MNPPTDNPAVMPLEERVAILLDDKNLQSELNLLGVSLEEFRTEFTSYGDFENLPTAYRAAISETERKRLVKTQLIELEKSSKNMTLTMAFVKRVEIDRDFANLIRKRILDACKRVENGCWKWGLRLDHEGYGRVRVTGRVICRAHRASFVAHGGKITKEFPHVLHSCHNAWCVNPEHLRAGSDEENVQDKFDAGRQHSKLSGENVTEIQHLLTCGEGYSSIAGRFGVGPQTVWKIHKGTSWKRRAPQPEPKGEA